MAPNRRFIEWFDAQAEVVEVPALIPWWRSTRLTKLTIDGNQVNERAPGTKLNKADNVLPALDRAPEDTAVEEEHSVQIYDAQHQVIDFADVNH